MKFKLKAALAAMLALVMALTAIPVSALPRFEAKAEIVPCWTVPDGYNAHDYNKCVEFLEQTDENGVKNGEKLSDNYDPNDPATWYGIYWSNDADRRAETMSLSEFELIGYLDVSGCTELVELDCSKNNITELNIWDCSGLEILNCHRNSISSLDVTNNPSLTELNCGANNLTVLNVSNNTELNSLSCYRNNLTVLNVSNNTKLYSLSCHTNNLTELDLSNNFQLSQLACQSNRLTELDLSNNPWIRFYNLIKAEGNGFIGLQYIVRNNNLDAVDAILFAQPINGASFDGFYSIDFEYSIQGNWNDLYQGYIYDPVMFYFNERIIARFSGGLTPGDIDGNGNVSVADAISTLRLSMGILDGSGMNTDAADMDGNGSITIADAIVILRTAMGLA